MRKMKLLKNLLLTSVLMAGMFTASQAATITVDVNETNVAPGEEFRYTINLDYEGSNGLFNNVELNDTIPLGVTYVDGSVSPAAAQYPATGAPEETISWKLGSNVAGIVGTASGNGSMGQSRIAQVRMFTFFIALYL